MLKTATVVPEPFVLSTLPPSRAQKRLSLAVVLAMLATFFVASGLLSHVQFPEVAAFLPAYAMAIVLSNLLTAILLFSQFSIFQTRALFILSSGYLFTALMAIAWILTFPGAFGPNNLVGGLQSTPYLYSFWHAGFPLFVIGYTVLKDTDSRRQLWRGGVIGAIAFSVALTTAMVFVAAFLFIAGDALLPVLQRDTFHLSSMWPYVGVPITSLVVYALILLWSRRQSVLDLWLMVVLCASAIELTLSYFPSPARYSFGWYAGRILGLVCSSLVLIVLLYEITTLYGRLLEAIGAQRREREVRLVTGDAVAANIAHEVNQPLSGMIASAEGGIRWLNRAIPDIDEAKSAFEHVIVAGHRMGEVIASIRANFKRDSQNRTPLDINELIDEALALMSRELQDRGIVVRVEPSSKLPQSTGDRIQLQQVLVNLINNAIDSLAASDEPRVLHVRSEVDNPDGVIVSVADTGPGVDVEHIGRIFTPLFTTKSDGLGMGLAICRAIIEAHDGKLWYSPNTPRGAVFHFQLTRG